MNISPEIGKPISLIQLNLWYMESLQKNETLEIFPCNPTDVPFLWCKATISNRDDIATLTQWLGGIPL